MEGQASPKPEKWQHSSTKLKWPMRFTDIQPVIFYDWSLRDVISCSTSCVNKNCNMSDGRSHWKNTGRVNERYWRSRTKKMILCGGWGGRKKRQIGSRAQSRISAKSADLKARPHHPRQCIQLADLIQDVLFQRLRPPLPHPALGFPCNIWKGREPYHQI